MKTLKKSIAVLLAVVMAFSCITVAGSAANADDPHDTATALSINTVMYRSDGTPAEGKVKRGETVYAYVYITTSYYALGGEIVFGYDPSYLTYQYPGATHETNVAFAASEGVLRVNAGSSANAGANLAAARGLSGAGAYVYAQVVKESNTDRRVYSGDNWLFRIPFTVKADADPEMKGIDGGCYGQVFTKGSWVTTPSSDGAIEFPRLTSAGVQDEPWDFTVSYSNDDEKVEVINNMVFFSGEDGTFVDDTTEYETTYYIGEPVSSVDLGVPQWKEDGSTVAKDITDWYPADSTGTPTSTTSTSDIQADYETKYYVASATASEGSITFNPNKGKWADSTTTSKKVNKLAGEEFTFDDAPTRDGYVFMGWGTSATATTTTAVPATVPNIPTTLYAVWTAIPYTVTYCVDGKIDSTHTYNAEDDIEYYTPTNLPDGYSYGGSWTTEGEGGTQVTAPTKMPAKSIIVNAVLTPDEQSVKYYVDGNYISESKPTTGTAFTPAKLSELSAYTGGVADEYFDGWYTDPGLNPNNKFTAGTKITDGGLNLYGKTAIPVTFNADGGTFSDGEATHTVTYPAGATISSHEEPTKADSTFTAWSPALPAAVGTTPMTVTAQYNTAEFTVKYYVDGTLVDVGSAQIGADIPECTYRPDTGYELSEWFWYKGDMTPLAAGPGGEMPNYDLIAMATTSATEHYVIYNSEGTEVKREAFRFGDPVTLTDYVPEAPEGKDFVRWEGTLPPTMPNVNITLNAVYDGHEYTITYNISGQDPTLVPVKYDTLITPATVEAPTGYEFSGWKWFDSAGHEISQPTRMPAGNVTAIGSITPKTNDVKYYDGDNLLKKFENVPYGTAKSNFSIPDPVKTGYVFNGWSPAVPDTMPDNEVIVYAKWNPQTYKLNYIVYKDGVVDPSYGSSDDVAYGTPLVGKTAPTPPEGYAFIGWINLPADGKMPAHDVDVYGRFEKVEPDEATYYINYYYMDTAGQYPTSVTPQSAKAKVGDEVDGSLATVPDGYTLDTTPTNSKVTGIVTDTPALQLNVYYKRASIVSTFDPDGGTIAGKPQGENEDIYSFYGAELQAPTVTKEGYDFKGWNPSVPGIATVNNTYTAQWEKASYKIIYDAAGGKFSDNSGSLEVPYDYGEDTAQTTPEQPTKYGYEFGGWSTTESFALGDPMPAHDVTFTAVWTPTAPNATFYYEKDDTKTPYSNTPVNFGESVSNPGTPTAEGKEFAGWKSWDTNGDVNFTNEKMDNRDGKKYYAAWTLKQYTLTYDANGGAFNDSSSTDVINNKAFGSAIENHEQPKKTGESFKEWKWYNADTNAPLTSAPITMPAYNVKAVAQYTTDVQPQTATFDANGGKWQDDSTTKTTTGNPGSDITIPSGTLSRDGYDFEGWSTDPSATTGTTNLGTMPETGATFYAVWKEKTPEPGTATFNPNSGTWPDSTTGNKSTTANPGEPVTAPAGGSPTRTGYTFEGWSTDPSATSGTNDLGNMPASGVNYYAAWKPKTDIPVVFDANGGAYSDSTTSKTEKFNYGAPITAPSELPLNPGNGFKGWATSPTGTPVAYLGTVDSESGKTFYAIWEETGYSISYYTTSNVTPYKVDTYPEGGTVTVPGDPGVSGTTFTGWKWYRAADKTETTEPSVMPAEDLIAIAQFEANKHSVTYQLNGGNINGSTDDVVFNDVSYGSAVPTCTTPSREGYSFAGWSPNPEGTMPDRDLVYVAQWTEASIPGVSYSLTYYTGPKSEGDVFKSLTLAEGASVPAPDTPKKFGKAFTGWKYYLADGTPTSAPSTMPASDVYAEAQWENKINPDVILPAVAITGIVVTPIVIGSIATTATIGTIAAAGVAGAILWALSDSDKLPKLDKKDKNDSENAPDQTPAKREVSDPDDDMISPDTGSTAGIAVFAIISGAAAAAFVIKSKKHDDDED